MAEINWRPWNHKTFKSAVRRNRPILLTITAKWCHWCHVMDAKVWADEAIANTVNERFVPVKVDTDARPDINERYNLGGWPTTAFLRPDGTLITGGTYIPLDKMRLLLNEVLTYPVVGPDVQSSFPEEGKEIAEPAQPAGIGEIPADAEKHFRSLLRGYFDREYGGFGSGLKFPTVPALEYGMTLTFETPGVYDEMLHKTLISMAESPMRDADGGFFRYAERRDWSSPHFEKLLIDQAEAAIAYINAYSLSKDDFYADVAHKALDYVESTLMRPDGLFGASQTSDASYYRLDAAARAGQPSPTVDKTAYSGWNARIVSALVRAGDILGRPDSSETALAALNCLFNRFQAKHVLFRHGPEASGADIYLLYDQVMLLSTLLDSYELSGNASFVAEADLLARAMRDGLFDDAVGAFRDRSADRGDVGALQRPLYPIDQNAKTAIALLRLFHITNNEEHLVVAGSAIGAFSRSFHRYGLNACDYASAVNWLTKPTLEIFLAGEKSAILTSPLWRKAKSSYRPRKVVIVDGRSPVKEARPAPLVTGGPAALVCVGTRCLEPAYDAEELATRLKDAA